ncbi:MAG TPA: GAF domain-containing sensor histidine kinase [Solirubrobacterales bacterium]
MRRVATSLAAHQTVQGSAEDLLGAALEMSGATSGSVYLLSLASGHYKPLCSANRSGEERGWPAVSVGDFNPRSQTSTVTRCVPLSRFLDDDRSGVAVLAFRKSTCLATLLLEDVDWDASSETTRVGLESTAALLVPVFHRRFASDLLDWLQMPLDFTRSEPEFLKQVGELIGASTGMEFSAIRELEEDGSLTCLGFWSHGEESQSSRFDIQEPHKLPPFRQAIESETAAVADIADEPEMKVFLKEAGMSSVRSFVAIPVRVGPSLFGVLSVAARCPFDYTDIELAGFESIANGLGVALRNFRSFHEATARVRQMTKAGLAITALEVATAARHEALNHQHEAQTKIGPVFKAVSGADAKSLKEASEKIKAAGMSLNKIRIAVAPPKRTLERVDLEELFEDARSQVYGRLQKERIKCIYTGPSVEIDAYPEYLRSAFENLLFNSIDALQEGKRRGRSIELLVQRPSPRDTHIRATFRDNGPGVLVQRLRVPEEEELEPGVNLIFEPGVTSKEQGSGFGLWLVRKIITDHKGSIDLRDFRQGTVFELKLKRELTEHD